MREYHDRHRGAMLAFLRVFQRHKWEALYVCTEFCRQALKRKREYNLMHEI